MRLPRALLLLAIAIVLAGCAAEPEYSPRYRIPRASRSPRIPQPPPAPPPTMDRVALVATFGDESGTKLLAVDGVSLEQEGPVEVGLRPIDEPPGMNSQLGIWLAPGTHSFHVRHVRNIEGGMALIKEDIRERLQAGHTYLVHPIVTGDRDNVLFSLVDYGRDYPLRCLPWAISVAKQRDVAEKRPKFNHDDITACLQGVEP